MPLNTLFFFFRHESKLKFVTPGPGSYEVSDVRRTGKEKPQGPTISGRHKQPQPFKTPSPGEYTPERRIVLNKSPAYSFGLKGKDVKPNNVPGMCYDLVHWYTSNDVDKTDFISYASRILCICRWEIWRLSSSQSPPSFSNRLTYCKKKLYRFPDIFQVKSLST